MAVQAKLRPTFKLADIPRISKALDMLIRSHMSSTSIDSKEAYECMRLKEYIETFAITSMNDDQKLEAMANKFKTGNVETVTESSQEIKVSVLERTDLTDEQIFDVLSATGDRRTEEENKWFLNKGTMIQMKRMMGGSKVTASDL